MQSVRDCQASHSATPSVQAALAFDKGFICVLHSRLLATAHSWSSMAYHPRDSFGNQQRYDYRDPEAEVSEQISRHHDLERGLDRMQEVHDRGPTLARVVMEECREARIRKQNKQILISVGVTIGLIVAVIWFVVTR